MHSLVSIFFLILVSTFVFFLYYSCKKWHRVVYVGNIYQVCVLRCELLLSLRTLDVKFYYICSFFFSSSTLFYFSTFQDKFWTWLFSISKYIISFWVSLKKTRILDWRYNSVTEYFPLMCETLCLIPSTAVKQCSSILLCNHIIITKIRKSLLTRYCFCWIVFRNKDLFSFSLFQEHHFYSNLKK